MRGQASSRPLRVKSIVPPCLSLGDHYFSYDHPRIELKSICKGLYVRETEKAHLRIVSILGVRDFTSVENFLSKSC